VFAGAISEKTFSLLKEISPLIREREFYLAGGSGLSLQIGHRISEDLDFFTSHSFDVSSLLRSLRPKVDRLQEILNEVQTLIADLDGIKCSFFYYDVPLLFDLVSFHDLKIADWRDILAEKFKTVAQRGSKKDFFDIFCAVKVMKISLDEAVSIFKKRFESSGLNLYHVLRSLTYFEDANQEPNPELMKGCNFSWEEIKSFFSSHQPELERLFLK
jgi:predicted nucleotidyltransferase component of viral defense system